MANRWSRCRLWTAMANRQPKLNNVVIFWFVQIQLLILFLARFMRVGGDCLGYFFEFMNSSIHFSVQICMKFAWFLVCFFFQSPKHVLLNKKLLKSIFSDYLYFHLHRHRHCEPCVTFRWDSHHSMGFCCCCFGLIFLNWFNEFSLVPLLFFDIFL